MHIKIDNLVKRIPNTGNFIEINNEKCTLCGRCLIICVANLWKRKGNGVYIIDDYTSKCLECGACYQVCEPGAISFRYPSGGTGVVFEKG
ncbi:MAG: 4Fe-4S dicluster domain-containing protein [Candidatus Thorarchaeota archaeon]|nr:4Fe-4S dicluster domain-containing protein [Candidatus Thorarchaeota archaeon]